MSSNSRSGFDEAAALDVTPKMTGGRNVQWNQEWELPPPKDDEGAIKLLQYSSEELLAILGDPLNEIGAGGFASVFRGQIPNGGVAVAVKCPREDKSRVGVLESLS